jgi:hypothetical protein
VNIYDPSNYICYVTMDRKFGPAAANGLRDIAYGADTRTRHLVPDSGALVRSSASRRDGRQHCRWGDALTPTGTLCLTGVAKHPRLGPPTPLPPRPDAPPNTTPSQSAHPHQESS